jgi:SAM-dependent methyltransferase
VALLETIVAPKYLVHFEDLALDSILESQEAQVLHLDCQTGSLHPGLFQKLPGCHVLGVDSSEAAMELAQCKAATLGFQSEVRYAVQPSLRWSLPEAAFSHGLHLMLPPSPTARQEILQSLGRWVAPHGQVVVAMPLRGSFLELLDLFREFAVKNESRPLADAIDAMATSRPTGENFGREMQSAGFEHVEVSTRVVSLSFGSGREFLEDAVTRLVLAPEVEGMFGEAEAKSLMAYAQTAIERYWQGSSFGLTLVVGCASGRCGASAT